MAKDTKGVELLSKGKRMITCIPHDTYEQLVALAKAEQTTVSVIVRKLIQERLRNTTA